MILDILPRNMIAYILDMTNAQTRHMWGLMLYRRRKARHDDECYKRVLWCLAQGPKFHPAHDHKHLAPGNDARFFYGVPPWNSDGTINCAAALPPNLCMVLSHELLTKQELDAIVPDYDKTQEDLDAMITDYENEKAGSKKKKKFVFENPNPGLAYKAFAAHDKSSVLTRPGVPPNFGEKETLGKNQALLDDWKAGWNCTRCEAWVAQQPRKFEGGKEPANWWWCKECRNATVRTLSLAEKKQQKAAQNCRRIESYM